MKTKNLIDDLSSDSWEKALNASDELSKYHSEDIFNQLIIVLNKAKTQDTVNATVLALREIKNNKAVVFLIQALDNPINRNNKSTILYALENLDCSKYFLKIFTLFVSSKSFDVKLSAYTILTEQKFTLTTSKILEAHKVLKQSSLSSEDIEIVKHILSEVYIKEDRID